jgi:hypothetical protein
MHLEQRQQLNLQAQHWSERDAGVVQRVGFYITQTEGPRMSLGTISTDWKH